MPSNNADMNEELSIKSPQARQVNRYQRVLHEYMESHLSRAFPMNHQFSENDLSSVTPESILKWMNKKICGDENLDLSDIPTPIRCSHHVLDFYKKSISYFMPNKGMAWDNGSKRGNPTRSKDVNDLIKKVKEIGDATAPGEKKRKRDTTGSGFTGLNSLPVTVPLTTAVANPDAVPVQDVLRRIVAQNSQFIELFGTLSETLKQFETNLRQNNQQILAEINALGTSVPPNSGASAPVGSSKKPPLRRKAKQRETSV